MKLHKTIQRFDEDNGTDRTEGRAGVTNLCYLVRAMGYDDLTTFLEDNSGCVEAIKEWIGQQSIKEWHEGLESQISNEYDEPQEYCPRCDSADITGALSKGGLFTEVRCNECDYEWLQPELCDESKREKKR